MRLALLAAPGRASASARFSIASSPVLLDVQRRGVQFAWRAIPSAALSPSLDDDEDRTSGHRCRDDPLSAAQPPPAPARPGDSPPRALQPACGLDRCCGPGIVVGQFRRFSAPNRAWVVGGRYKPGQPGGPPRPGRGGGGGAALAGAPDSSSLGRVSLLEAREAVVGLGRRDIKAAPSRPATWWPSVTGKDTQRSTLHPPPTKRRHRRIGPAATQWRDGLSGPRHWPTWRLIKIQTTASSPRLTAAPSMASSPWSPAQWKTAPQDVGAGLKIVEMGANAGQERRQQSLPVHSPDLDHLGPLINALPCPARWRVSSCLC